MSVTGWLWLTRTAYRRLGYSYSTQRSVIRKENDVDGRASVTKDEERVLRGD